MNKFHFQVLEKTIDQYANFIKEQVVNLRSNNSRNAMTLFLELFKENCE